MPGVVMGFIAGWIAGGLFGMALGIAIAEHWFWKKLQRGRAYYMDTLGILLQLARGISSAGENFTPSEEEWSVAIDRGERLLEAMRGDYDG